MADARRATHKNTAKAFTLIELSIVLVIIGLLVGGVLVGQDLIQAAKLRSVIKEFEATQTAILVFKAKYNKMPGSWAYAESSQILGTIPGCNNTCASNKGALYVSASLVFWHQLYLAGLSDFQPSPMIFANEDEAGTTARPSVLGKEVGWKAVTRANWWSPVLPNHLVLATSSSVTSFGRWSSGVLTPADAFSIDTKIDDGIPNNTSIHYIANGVSADSRNKFVVAANGEAKGGGTQVCHAAGVYVISNTNKGCVLGFKYAGNSRLSEAEPDCFVFSMVAEKGYGPSIKPRIRYVPLEQCLLQLAQEASALNAAVQMPAIGCGLAGGRWTVIRELVAEALLESGISTTVYRPPGKPRVRQQELFE
jgi:prepilin-type N-terminal cleavage/methylation domain-containing protein